MERLTEKEITRMRKDASTGWAKSTRLFNYQIKILLYYANKGIAIERGNKAEREVIAALTDVEKTGILNG